jgi:signal transduction histidine kinase
MAFVTTRAHVRLWIALLAFLAVLLPSVAARAEAQQLTQSLRSVRLVAGAEVLEDPTHELTIEAVSREPESGRFAPVTWPSLGYRSAAFWVRFSVRRETTAPTGWMVRLNMTPYRAELYEEAEGGGYRVRVSGTSLPFTTREVDDPHIAFRIEPPASRVATYYLRLEFDDSVWLQPELVAETEYASRLASEKLFDGVYYGAILSLIAYNALLFLVTRDRASLMYVVFELALVLSLGSSDRVTFEYLWPRAPMWASRAQAVFGCASIYGALGFARSFLALDTTAPRLARLYAGLMVGALLSVALTAASGLRPFYAAFALLLPALVPVLGAFFCLCLLTLIGTGILLARRGAPGATLYLVAWILLCTGVVGWILCANGILPVLVNAVWVKSGSFAEATLLSLGLATRVNGIRQAAERARARLSEARVERLAALGRLVAGFAHEIGNPLNFVHGGAAEAGARLAEVEARVAAGEAGSAEFAPVVAAAQQAVRLVVAGSDRMKQILDNLRCYVRGRDVEPVLTDLGDSVRSTVVLAAPLLERTGTRLTLDVADGATVNARPGELEQVVMNLLVNACQAMGERGELSIRVSVAADRVSVVVEDSGPGIPESEREAVFEPFFTTRQGRDGMGLGLYMSSDMVRRNGGELWVEGGRAGARFVVRLPRSG